MEGTFRVGAGAIAIGGLSGVVAGTLRGGAGSSSTDGRAGGVGAGGIMILWMIVDS